MNNLQWFIIALFLKSSTASFCEEASYCTCNKHTVTCNDQQINSVPKSLPLDVKIIEINQCQLVKIQNDDFNYLSQLESISIANNKLNDIEPLALQSIFTLKKLILNDNELGKIKTHYFQHLSSLEILDLRNNGILHVDLFAFSTLPLWVYVMLGDTLKYCKCAFGDTDYVLMQLEAFGYPYKGCKTWESPFKNNGTITCTDENDVHNKTLTCMVCKGNIFGLCLKDKQTKTIRNIHHDIKIQKRSQDDRAEGSFVCSNTFTYEQNKITVEAGLMSLSHCMDQEMKNGIRCVHTEDSRSMSCHFCCLQSNCNEVPMGGIISDETFYIIISLESEGSEDDYNSILEKIEQKMKDALDNEQLPVEQYALGLIIHDLNGKLSYYAVYTTTLYTKKRSSKLERKVKGAINMQLLADVTEENIKVKSVEITREEILFCKEEITEHDGINFSWNVIRAGGLQSLDCLLVNMTQGSNTIKKVATRYCSGQKKSDVRWEKPDFTVCTKHNVGTLRALESLGSRLSSENQDQISNQLLKITTDVNKDRNKVRAAATITLMEKFLTIPPEKRTTKTTKNLISTVSSVINFNADVVTDVSSGLRGLIDTISSTTSVDKGDFTFKQDNVAVAVQKVDKNNFKGSGFWTTEDKKNDYSVKLKDSDKSDSNDQDASTNMVIPHDVLNSLGKSEKFDRISFTLFNSDMLFVETEKQSRKKRDTRIPKKKFDEKVNSKVIAGSIPNVETQDLDAPIVISFSHKITVNVTRPRCVHWVRDTDTGYWKWSEEGCSLKQSVDGKFSECSCNHLTNFALVMDIYSGGITFSEADETALSVISYIGCGASLLALIFTIATYIRFRKLRRDRPSRILVNLCIALAITNFIFVAGMQDYTFRSEWACTIVAMLMHYFLLSAMAWMAVEAANMYLSLVVVFGTEIEHFIIKCSIFGWGIPFLIVVLTVIINYPKNYGIRGGAICWLIDTAFYTSFLAPVVLILLVNCAAFGLVVREICRSSSVSKSSIANTITRLRGAVVIIVLLGLTYMFAFFAINESSIVFYYLFAVFNSLQGVFIFIFYVLLKKDALQAWKGLLHFERTIDEESYYSTTRQTTHTGAQSQSTGFSTDM